MSNISRELIFYSVAGILSSILVAGLIFFSNLTGVTGFKPFSQFSLYLLSSSAGAILLYLYRGGTGNLEYSMMEEFIFVIAVTLLTPLVTFSMGFIGWILHRYN